MPAALLAAGGQCQQKAGDTVALQGRAAQSGLRDRHVFSMAAAVVAAWSVAAMLHGVVASAEWGKQLGCQAACWNVHGSQALGRWSSKEDEVGKSNLHSEQF